MPNPMSSATELRFVCAGQSCRIAAGWSTFYGPPKDKPNDASTWWLRAWDLDNDVLADYQLAQITLFYP